jgi:hypothetical protein
MMSDSVSNIANLTPIIWARWNITPIKSVKNEVYFVGVAVQHDAPPAHVADYLYALQHCSRGYSIFGSDYVCFAAQIDKLRDHFGSLFFQDSSIFRDCALSCQLKRDEGETSPRRQPKSAMMTPSPLKRESDQ